MIELNALTVHEKQHKVSRKLFAVEEYQEELDPLIG